MRWTLGADEEVSMVFKSDPGNVAILLQTLKHRYQKNRAREGAEFESKVIVGTEMKTPKSIILIREGQVCLGYRGSFSAKRSD